ncbi:hypothetical protein HLB44_05585 [Aquincola sp. S2]|uniref:Beta-ketoacyl synthase N-terminal domain-containing protein n=1 Tax=Pseudaquabacterium terrae TaxID=2732868 RepID=A0ABX2EDK6_9BURK|nr:hypothetical protein [Aquabacterium terrae]NRF66448.1 hypothetical protein [Aquabacterium terrae]
MTRATATTVASRSIEGGGVLVAAAGMVCALGYDAASACAAARAGLSRAAVLPHYRARSGVEGDEEAIIGHAASLFTAGFEGEARLLRLLQGALADLLAGALDPALWLRRVGLYVGLPDPMRTAGGVALMSEPPAGAGEDDDPPEPEELARRTPAAVTARLLDQALRLAHWPGAPMRRHLSTGGQCAGAELIAAAANDIQQRSVDVAVVLTVDSLLDEDTLTWLHHTGRLKCDAAPAGLQPGEAAVALALLPAQDAAAAPDEALRLIRLAFDSEDKAQIEGEVSSGEALARVVDAALARPADGAPWLFSDHNGEVYRANDFGCALTRLRAGHAGFAAPIVWYPALSFGDTGTCAAPLAIAMALQARSRRYAPADSALVCCAADGRGRAALLLQRL